jgi:proteasome lid subunit RPN8/RPN11
MKITMKHKPKFFVDPSVMEAINVISQHSDTEVGFFGLVKKLDQFSFLLYDIYIPKQKCSSVSVKVDTEDSTNWINSLVEKSGGDLDILRNVAFWGHTHPHMGTFPSHVDDNLYDSFATKDWFFWGIFNEDKEKRTINMDWNEHNIKISEIPMELHTDISSDLIKQEIQKKVTPLETVDIEPGELLVGLGEPADYYKDCYKKLYNKTHGFLSGDY